MEILFEFGRMNCLDFSKIEAWLAGKDPTLSGGVVASHLRTCPECRQRLQLALALKAVAALPACEYDSSFHLTCALSKDDTDRLSYLDDTLDAGERRVFENHLLQCTACRCALLLLESEITEVEWDEVEVPGFIVSKARRIGEAEITRQESRNWATAIERAFTSFGAAVLQPRWAAAAAAVMIAVTGSVVYLRYQAKQETRQQARIETKTSGAAGQTKGVKPASHLTPAPSVAPETVAQVEKVFAQIERVSNSHRSKPIQLKIVSSNEYIAQISPAGELTLSTQYIAATQNEDELAFLLAHEVAHWRHPAACILSFSTSANQPASLLNSAEQKRAELEADRRGVFLAAVAGYHANAAESLFSRIKTIPDISDASHPAFSARLEETAGELKSIVRSVELFQVGVSFFNTEQYSRSVAVFDAAARLFPSREVYNDLGLAYHKLALEYSPQNWGFKKSVILDPVARAIEPVREDLPQANLFTEFLKQAVAQYRRALSRDPDYLAARINLASALDDQGDTAGASRELEGVLKQAATKQERAKALNNLGVLSAKQGRLKEAENLFQHAAEADAEFPDAHFNRARVLEMQSNGPAATAEYARFAQLAGNSRDGWLRMAYNKLNQPWSRAAANATGSLPKLGSVQLGATLSSIVKLWGPPAVSWNLKTPTQFDFFVNLFESAGLMVSGAENVIDFVQTTPGYSGLDSANQLAPGLTSDKVHILLKRATRIPLTGFRESYVDFNRGLGIDLRNRRVDVWYIFEPLS